MKKLLFALLILIILGFGILAKYLIDRSIIFTGFAAKNIASGVFIAKRTQESIEKLDIHFFPVTLATTKVDTTNKIVTSIFFGFGKQTAIYREGLGVCLLSNYNKKEILQQKLIKKAIPLYLQNKKWPKGEKIENNLSSIFQKDSINKILNWALKEGNTRAILIAYDTLGIIEKYNNEFDKNSLLLGWSITKSIFNALTGVLVKDQKLQLDSSITISEWQNDKRKNITVRSLLTMNSGLEWEEDYGDISDVTLMLYNEGDKAAYAINKKLKNTVNSVWQYSSGTSNILSEIVKKQFKNNNEYWNFPYERLFYRIGMYHTILEADASGHFVASSYSYANARDWARFGLLYLNNGIWFGDTVLSPEWVSFSKKEAPNSNGKYGAQFWLNKSGYELPNAPKDIFYADGYQGQRIYIIPSKKLVIVRFGISKKGEFDYDHFVCSIINALKE